MLPSSPSSPTISATRATSSSSASVADSPVVPPITRPFDPLASRWRPRATAASSFTAPSARNGVTIAVSSPSYGRMAIVSQAGRRLRQPASGSPWVTLGASVLGWLRSSGAPASGVGPVAAGVVGAAGAEGGAPGVAGAPGSGVGPVRAGADGVSVGGTPGVATGGAPAASGVTPAGWTGRPCLSYSTAPPPSPPPASWPELNCFCASSSLACACSAIFFALSMKPMVALPVRVLGARQSTRLPPRLQGVREPARDPWVLAVLPQRHHQQLVPRAVPQAHERHVAVAHVDRAALRRGARRRLVGDVPRGPRARDPARDLRPRVQRPAHPLAVPLDRVVRDGHERRAHASRRARTTRRPGGSSRSASITKPAASSARDSS